MLVFGVCGARAPAASYRSTRRPIRLVNDVWLSGWSLISCDASPEAERG